VIERASSRVIIQSRRLAERMNFIDDYLKREHHLHDLLEENDSQEIKLEFFFNLFIELEKKYVHKIDDMKRLEVEHKTEINNVNKILIILFMQSFTIF
jgi:hypothetical protein